MAGTSAYDWLFPMAGGFTASDMITAGSIAGRKKIKHMNPTNFKSLKRALRRIQRFDKLVKRVIHVEKTGPKFKRKRRR